MEAVRTARTQETSASESAHTRVWTAEVCATVKDDKDTGMLIYTTFSFNSLFGFNNKKIKLRE